MQHNPAKVTLSKYEMELVTNAQILLTKNEIIKKVYELFGLLAGEYVDEVNKVLPAIVGSAQPKISRGENYLGLPYVMMDYPRNFSRNDTFAIRTFFWWGNFFSITLQLSGSFQEQYKPCVAEAVKKGVFKNWYQCTGSDMWHHHFDASNYRLINESDTGYAEHGFTKLAAKIPLSQWPLAEDFLRTNFSKLVAVLSS
jgi:hypothetical protein